MTDPAPIIARLRAAGCVFAEEEADLLIAEASSADRLAAMVDRRVGGDPLEHVLGWVEFCGLRIRVDPGVFVPRQRTRFLVRTAARLVGPGRVTVVDLCCGSGALGVALAARVGDIDVHAADIDPASVACAGRNLAALGGHAYLGDLFDALPVTLRGRIDIMLANVPYVPTAEIGMMPPEARDHEPRGALDGGADGLDVMRRVTAAAPDWLAPGGCVLFEIGKRQQAAATQAVIAAGLEPTVEHSAKHHATVMVARRG